MSDDFDLKQFVLPGERWAVVPRKIQKRREHFVMMPWTWLDPLNKLRSASANTYRVAHSVRYQHWKDKGKPFKLANGMVGLDGITPDSKRRALAQLEGLGLIKVERRPRKSPIVTVVIT